MAENEDYQNYDEDEESPEQYPEDELHPDYDNHEYAGGSDHKLLSSKEARKKAEEDSRLLANRIALLKLEERKAWKKIEETKKKAKQIMHQRHYRQQVNKDRRDRENEKDKEHEKLKKRNQQIKEQLKQNINSKKQEFYETVKDDVDHFKREKEDQKELLDYQKREEQLRNTTRKQMIRNNQKEAKERREQDLEDKMLQAKRALMDKILKENHLRLEKEARVRKLEEEELHLIENLQNTQVLQKQAYNELEEVLDGKGDDF